MRIAAIDIGSNAARLLITEVIEIEGEKPFFNKLNLVRVPLRLGFDVFEKGEISKAKIGMILQTMKAYKHLLNAYEVIHVRACATSAMRDAKNSADVVRKIKMETGIDIEVLSGSNEAAMIYENHIAENMDTGNSYLYVDVGGGSTELTFYGKGKLIFKESFNIGTIRILKDQVNEELWNSLKEFLKNNTKSFNKVVAIGTGGNINKIFSMSKRKDGKPLPYEALREFYKELGSFTVDERILKYNMRVDRADVIVPALLIYTCIMRWAGIEEIYVPKIGLADGITHAFYEQLTKTY